MEEDAVQEEVLMKEKKELFDFIKQDWEDYDVGLESPEEYTRLLYVQYEYFLWNSLHSVIFGADAYR